MDSAAAGTSFEDVGGGATPTVLCMQAFIKRVADLIGRGSTAVRVMRPLYRSVLAAAYRDRGMPWEINGVPVRIDPALREEMGQVYDPTVVAWLRPRVRPGQVVWNVGANVGVYALQFAHWVGESGHVVALEPNPVARRALERHVAWNALTGRVTVVGMAVGDAEGEAKLWADGASTMGAIGRPNPALAERARPVTVPITTLDLLEERGLPRPDWIVMDIEGYELFALRGAERLLSEAGPALGIVLELHPNVWTTLGQSEDTLHALLARHDRRIVSLRDAVEGDTNHAIVALESVPAMRRGRAPAGARAASGGRVVPDADRRRP